MYVWKRGKLIFFSQKALNSDVYLSTGNSVKSLPRTMLKSDTFFLTGYISSQTATISPTVAVQYQLISTGSGMLHFQVLMQRLNQEHMTFATTLHGQI